MIFSLKRSRKYWISFKRRRCNVGQIKSNQRKNMFFHFFVKIKLAFWSIHNGKYIRQRFPTKLMRSNRGHAEIRSKSYSNRLLIYFFDPNLPVRSIIATISIRIRIQIYQKSSILSKIRRI